jgi:cytochrome c oxidase cbb3-type subunit III
MNVIRLVCVTALILLGCALWKSPAVVLHAAPQGPPGAAQQAPPVPNFTADDVTEGKKLFQGECGECHGVDGSGGVGPNLHGVIQKRHEQGVFLVIRNGIPGTGMAPVSNLNDKRAWQVVAYLRTLSATDSSDIATGDPVKGKDVYAANGCSICHAIGGKGGGVGPELTRIGEARSPRYLHDFLLDPGKNPPSDARLPERGQFTGYLVTHVVTKQGQSVTGIRVNEDTFTIQLRDVGGHYYSFDKSDIAKLETEPGKSVMPSFTNLSATDLNNLVAYLWSLKGAQ